MFSQIFYLLSFFVYRASDLAYFKYIRLNDAGQLGQLRLRGCVDVQVRGCVGAWVCDVTFDGG